jgi:hypothetical protein
LLRIDRLDLALSQRQIPIERGKLPLSGFEFCDSTRVARKPIDEGVCVRHSLLVYLWQGPTLRKSLDIWFRDLYVCRFDESPTILPMRACSDNFIVRWHMAMGKQVVDRVLLFRDRFLHFFNALGLFCSFAAEGC